MTFKLYMINSFIQKLNTAIETAPECAGLSRNLLKNTSVKSIPQIPPVVEPLTLNNENSKFLETIYLYPGWKLEGNKFINEKNPSEIIVSLPYPEDSIINGGRSYKLKLKAHKKSKKKKQKINLSLNN